jgi:hypothetical protein
VGILTRLGAYIASPFAFLVVFGYGALWYLYKPETFERHAGATMNARGRYAGLRQKLAPRHRAPGDCIRKRRMSTFVPGELQKPA